MPITTTIDPEKQLAIHRVEGNATFDEAMEAIKKYYSGKTTPNLLWDFSAGSLVKLSPDQITLLAEYIQRVSGGRITGKTAGLVSHDVDFGLARVFETLFESSSYKPLIRIFRNSDDAMRWLRAK